MFEQIIRSVLTHKDNAFTMQVCAIIAKMELSREETLLIRDIVTCIKGSAVPSLNVFIEKYRDSIFADDSLAILSKDDIFTKLALLAQQRKNSKVARELMQLATEISRDGYNDSIHSKLSSIASSAVSSKSIEYEDPLVDAKAIYEAKKQQGSGLKFGVEVIDKAIGGITPGSFNVIFAYTGSFKTLSAINIAYNNSFKQDFNILYLSFEVEKSDLMWNIYSRHSFEMHSPKFPYLPHDKMRHAQLSEKEESFLYDDVIPDYQQNKKGKLYLLDETDFESVSFMGVEKRLREMEAICKKETGKGLDCVIVDQAQLLKFGASDAIGNEGSVINAWVSFFRQQCINFLGTGRPIAVIMLSQANREGWKRAVKNEGRYDMRAISEANELERAAWRIFAIFTDENMKTSKEAKVQCLKNRTGLTVMDPVVVFVDPVCYTFGEVGSGFNDSLSVDSLDDIFSDSFDTGDLFG